MQKHIRKFVELAVKSLPVAEPVYEFGSLQVHTDEPDADLRPLFKDLRFVGADFREGIGVDHVLDLHDIDLQDDSVGTVIALDTLEHVEYPRQAVREMHRVLKPGGIAIISSVMNFPIHGYPNDYWRFTPEGFRSLLNVFEDQFVGSCGSDPDFPQSVVGVGFKGPSGDISGFEADYALWERWSSSVIIALQGNDRS
jgi:SAM-dependent methyltransferase